MAFISAIEHPVRQKDALSLLSLFESLDMPPPKMWGAAIIGYDEYSYRYESGRQGTWMRTGFSPRKQNMVVYVMPGFSELSGLLDDLGKHKCGKSCLYINKLADIDLNVLKNIIKQSLDIMAKKYPK